MLYRAFQEETQLFHGQPSTPALPKMRSFTQSPPASRLPYQITILTAISPGDYQVQYRHAIASRNCYAVAHGYSHIIDSWRYPRSIETGAYDWSWGKVHAGIQRMEIIMAKKMGAYWAGGGDGGLRGPPTRNEWLFFVDADFALQRLATPLEAFFDPLGKYDFFVSDNLSNEINMGFFAVRVGDVGLTVLRRLQQLELLCPETWRLMEQSAFNYLLAIMLQETLCPGPSSAAGSSASAILPLNHSVCATDLTHVLREPGHCFDPSLTYFPFFSSMPPELWSYGNRKALPWLHAYKYSGNDSSSPLVDINRFDEHSAKHNPLSNPTDWASHSKHMQKSYLSLVKDMDSIGHNEPFCKKLFELRP